MFELKLYLYKIFIVILLSKFIVHEDLILVLIKYSHHKFYTYLFWLFETFLNVALTALLLVL